ncbi:MAG: helix-turn-helix protein [Clostridiales bacterium]|jgi:transcriptional regulator with XRE-family HTH domain|nr:helix-turn-helix protein [Clostridiales bacterium]
MSRVGKQIQDARMRTGVSAKQLAKKLGVSESFINEVESGKKIINEDLIRRVEKTLEISLNEEVFVKVAEPVENLKEIESTKVVNKQMEDAFSHILKKIPVCDINFKEIFDYKYLPIIDKKVEGYNGDKIIYIKVPDDSMRGFRIQRGDRLLVYQNQEFLNNSIVLLEMDGKRCIRQIKRLDSNKILVISHSNDLKTETKDVKSINIIGRCTRLEVEL